MTIKAVGFDLDDTLYDRNEVYKKVYSIMENTVTTLGIPFAQFEKVFQQKSIQQEIEFSKGLKDSIHRG